MMGEIEWRRVNGEPFEYAIQQGPCGDEFVKLLDGSCLRRMAPLARPKTIDESLSVAFGPGQIEIIKELLSENGYAIISPLNPNITREMLDMGREPISSRWCDFTGPDGAELYDEVLTEVFQTMLKASVAVKPSQ
jgi:hypothetical protein